MAAKSSSLSHVYLLVLFLVLISGGLNGGELKAVKASGGQRTWCVAKPSSDEKTLLENIDYACSHVDCSIILRKGCPCSSPDNLMNHASIAMNLLLQSQWM